MPTVHAQVDVKTKRAVAKAAEKEGVAPSVIIRWALESYLKGAGYLEVPQPKDGAAA